MPSEPRAVRDFLALSHWKERDDFLREHLFWKDPQVHDKISGPVLLAIIEHISQCLLGYVAENPGVGIIEKKALDSRAGLLWSTPTNWGKWQQRLLDLRKDVDWNHAQRLLHHVLRFGAVHADAREHDGMLPYAEQMLKNGMHFDLHCLARVAWRPSCENQNPYRQLEPYPLVLAQLTAGENDAQLEQITLENPKTLHWLSKINSRIDAWSLAERCTTRQQLEDLHHRLHDEALFKAWHGIPLNAEEVHIHPLAHSLYVHRHAPVYLSEVQPLPEHWRLALELSNTGEQFKKLLLQAQSNVPAPMLTLPSHFLEESPPAST